MKYFVQGMVGGAALVVAFLICVHAGYGALFDRDWGYLAAQAVAASIIGIGGVLVLLSALEIT